MKNKPLEQLTAEELTEILHYRFHLEYDEIKALYKTDAELLEAVKGAIALTKPGDDKDEASFGWDTTDKTRLTRDQLIEVNRRRKTKQVVKGAKEQKQDAALEKSLAETKADVTKEDVKKALESLTDLTDRGDPE